jgi:arabinogalactan oligomer/maltooligosaccharide transport system permease protein
MKLKVIGLNVLVTALCFLTLYPVLWVVKMAFSASATLSPSANPLPVEPTLRHFRDVLMNTDLQGRWLFGRQLFASFYVSTLSTLIGLSLAVTAAYAISRFKFRGRELGLQGLLVTQMFPGTLMLVAIYKLLQALHLLDTWTGLVLVYSTTSLPFCIWMLKGYFDALPKELEEAALMDGASQTQVFVKIVLPLSRPALAVTALFAFMTAWNEYILAATLINDETRFTLPVALKRYVGEYNAEWDLFAAGAILISVPVMALFFALQKNLVGGLTAGGVKG